VTLASDLKTAVEEGAPNVREFRPSDRGALCALARVSHTDTRFFFDGGFEAERCHALYQTWIEKSSNGYADAVWVAETERGPSGYVSCHLSAEGTGRIGLLAVHSEERGRGLARQLVSRALEYFGCKGMTSASVVTQGRNIAAQRLYQRCGFVTDSIQLWYHRWFDLR